MNEIWKDIEGYEGKYQVSSIGRIKSLIGKEKILTVSKPTVRKNGALSYPKIKLSGKSFEIHRIVAKAFIPNPENKTQVNHIIKDLNNYTVNNLEWNTVGENIKHKLNYNKNMRLFSNIIHKEIKRIIPLPFFK